jgi:hypothetical protein
VDGLEVAVDGLEVSSSSFTSSHMGSTRCLLQSSCINSSKHSAIFYRPHHKQV